ncbi:hypothetical protein ACF0H5_002856 [Mactra antiquata]
MYDLFKLVRLLSVKNDVHPVTVDKFTWRQNGESSFLALSCSNGFLVLRYCCTGCQPVVKQIPWPPDLQITSMCFDPTVSWLLVQTENGNLFIIPALTMMDPSCQVNQLWSIDDVTIISSFKTRGTPTVTTWWCTLEGKHIAIVATKLGEILFIDLIERQLLSGRCVDEYINNIELIKDDQQTMTSLLITGYSGKQWKMLLEKTRTKVAAPDTELSELGYDNIDGLSLPSINVLQKLGDEEPDRFEPIILSQFARSVTLSPQYAKGRHFVSAYCTKNSLFQVYDSNMEHNPLFVYKLPVGSLHTILTDRIMFLDTKLAGDQKLLILSNQRAEISEDGDQNFNSDAVLQQFEIPADEVLQSVIPKSFPFYWHEKLESDQIKLLSDQDEIKADGNSSTESLSAIEIPVRSHTVLDGCIIITNTGVYECRPRASPERLFLELCLSQPDSKVIEQLGISLGLDLNFLLEVAADFLLCHGRSKQATRLFHMSKASPVNRIASFAKYGFIHEIMPFLLQMLRKERSSLNGTKYKYIIELGLHGLILKLSEEPNNEDVITVFRKFVQEFSDYEDTQRTTLRLLSQAKLQTLLLDFAVCQGLVIEALEELSEQGQYHLTDTCQELLVERGYGAHLAQVASGAFLHLLDIRRLVKIFCERPQLITQHPDLLLDNLSDLDIDDLLRLADVLDPSKPIIRGYIHRKMKSRRRTDSLTSLTGSGEFVDSVTVVNRDRRNVDASRLVYCFLTLVLHLNNRRKVKGEPVHSDFLFKDMTSLVKNIVEKSQSGRQKISCKPNPIGCGQMHAAVALRNGDLYTWGKTNNGRLGHGEVKGSPSTCGPCKVSNLLTLKIKVTSIACGMQHTIALTQQGLYGWGASKYGQVGLGTRHTYTRPMPLEEMSKINCIAVDCGQYHSVALTEDANVYSWGWGVHGQLGHGDTEEMLIPKLVSSLTNMSIVKVATGYCHTLALNSQGEVYSFGCGFFGQLGLGTSSKHTLPVKISLLPEKIETIGTKFFHNVAVDTKNRVFQWGCHPHGLRHFVMSQRRSRHSGHNAFEQADGHLRPRIVDTTYLNGKIKHVSCGSFHSCLVTKDGDVYTWGKNLDGQLGNGSRQDGRIPQMVTSINDKHIVHLTSGGEYNVAMDTDSQIWVWGRNEFCQLGLTSSDVRQPAKVIRTIGMKSAGQHLTEVLLPTQLNLLPGSPTSMWQYRSLAETFSISESMESLNTWNEDDQSTIETMSCLNLPNLSDVGDVLYDRITIPIVIQCAPNLCDSNQLLRDAITIKDWCVAASINLYLGNYTQAMSFHFNVLRDGLYSSTELDDLSMKVTQYYYRLIKESQFGNDEVMKNFLYEIFYHWEIETLSVNLLEEFLDPLLDTLAVVLSTIMFRSVTKQDADEKTQVDLFAPSRKFLKSFTTKFCLKLSSIALMKIQTENMSSLSSLKDLGGKGLSTIPVSILEGDKLPYGQIWQDIMQNLQKGHESRKYIYVTHSEIDRLEEHQNYHDRGQGHADSAVFFTCGHYFTKGSFINEIDRMNKDMSSTHIKLPETLSVIKQYYSRQGHFPLACPRCVLSAIMCIS